MKLLEQLARLARTDPERIFWQDGTELLTYGGLWRNSGAMAAALAKRLAPGDRPVALLCQKAPWVPAAMLACIRLGRPYLPVDSRWPAPRVAHIFADANPALALGWGPPGTGPWLEPDALTEESADFPPRELPDRLPLYYLYTSGSTGGPKGVAISRGNLSAFLDWLTPLLPGSSPALLGTASYAFDLSALSLYGAMATGGRVWELCPGLFTDFPRLFDSLARSGAQVWVSTPSTAALCLADPAFSPALLPCLRQFFFCGETLSPALARRLYQRFPHGVILNSYGPTEATVAVTAVAIPQELALEDAPLPVGRFYPEGPLLVVDEALSPVPHGVTGQLLLEGEQVGLGYLGADQGGFLRLGERRAYATGDYGYIRQGLVYFTGRRDGQLKYRGHRVETGELEGALEQLEGVTRGAAVLPADGILTAFVSPDPGRSSACLRRELLGLLPSYLLPGRILPLEQMPLTPNGKLDRRALLALAPVSHRKERDP